MSVQTIGELFNVRSHNPSFFSIKNTVRNSPELLDFCVPVNLHFPPPELLALVRENLPEILRYYPDYSEVHQKYLADITRLSPETIVPCNGSTEIITKLCQMAKGPIVTSVPTFSRWTDLPEESQLQLHTIPRRRENQFRLEVDEIIEVVRTVGARTLVISNPNNPTGAGMPLQQIISFTSALQDLEAVIIDESFIDFSDLESAASCVSEWSNLIVVKSLGKSLGWHGIRLGYAAAEPQRARALRDTLPFWNINGLAAYVLKTVTEFLEPYQASFLQVSKDRSYMKEKLSSIPDLTVYPSKANFLFVELPEDMPGRKLRDRLLRNYGILVRECSNKIGSSEQYMRLAVQTPAAADYLIHALREEFKRSHSKAKPRSGDGR